MSEDLIAQACAKIERLQAGNNEYRQQVETLTAKMNEQEKQLAYLAGERDGAQAEIGRLNEYVKAQAETVAAREAALTEARKHVSELREGFCVYACPDDGHLATCIEASKWLAS